MEGLRLTLVICPGRLETTSAVYAPCQFIPIFGKFKLVLQFLFRPARSGLAGALSLVEVRVWFRQASVYGASRVTYDVTRRRGEGGGEKLTFLYRQEGVCHLRIYIYKNLPPW